MERQLVPQDTWSLALSSNYTCCSLIVSPDNVNWLPYITEFEHTIVKINLSNYLQPSETACY